MPKIDDILARYSDKFNQPNDNSISAKMDDAFRYLRTIQTKPIPVQITIGVSGGFLSSYFLTRISKFFAVVAGVSMIFVQFLNYRGYLKFRKNQLQRDLDYLSGQIRVSEDILPQTHRVGDFVSKNTYLLGGFTAGSLIGYGMA